MSYLLSNGMCILVPRPSRQPYHHKFESHNRLDRYNGFLVFQSFTQQPGLHYDENFSKVIKPKIVCTVLSIVASRHWPYLLDVENAILNGDLREEVYMKQTYGYVHLGFLDHLCKLRKTLCLKQAPDEV